MGADVVPRDRSLRDIAWVASGHAGRLAFAVVASVVAARVLGPDGMGVVTLVMALVGVAVALSEPGLRVSSGKVVARALAGNHPQAAQEAVQTFLGARLLLALPLCLGLVVGVSTHPDLAGAPWTLPWVAAWALMAMIVGQHAQAITEMASAFKGASSLLMLSGVARAGVLIALAVGGVLRPDTMIAAEGCVAVLGGVLLVWGLGSPIPGAFRPRWVGIGSLLKRSGWLGVGVVMGLLLSRVDVLALARGVGAAEIGIYGVAATLAMRAEFLKNAVLTVWYPPIAAAEAGQLASLVTSARATAAKVSLLLYPYLLVAVVALVWGAGLEFLPGLVPLVFLLGAVAVQLLVEPESLVLYAHWPRAVAMTDTALLVLAGGGALWAAETSGAGGVAAVMLLTRLVVGAVKVAAARYYVKVAVAPLVS